MQPTDTGQKYYKYNVGGGDYVEARPNVGGAAPSGQTEIDYNTFKSEARRIGTSRLQKYLGQSTSYAPGMGDANRRAALQAFEQYGGQSTLDKLLAGGDDFEALGRANMLDPKQFQQNLQSGVTMVNGVPTKTADINPLTGKIDVNQALSAQGASGIGAIPGMNTQTGAIVNPTQFKQYQDAMKGIQATGVPAPQSGGEARGTVQNAMQQATAGTPQPNPVLDNLFQTDANMGNFSKMVQDFLNPQNQGQTLKQEYESLMKEQGIQGLNTELMNMKNVIEGAEDDIRSEITKAGGFATDSQVMALTNARNKTLIKNYNNLLQTKQQAQDYVDTLIGLSKEDKAAAAERLDSQLNLSTKLIEMEQGMQKNARDTLQNIVDTVGYQGLLQATGNSPYYTNMVEQTLGLGQGGLQRLASVPVGTDNQIVKLDNGQTVVIDKNTGEIVRNVGGAATPSTIGGIDEKTMGKIQASPEYKTINSVLPTLQTLMDYKNAITKYGSGELFSGSGSGELKGTYGNALAAWKSLAGLGALSGADFGLAENAVPEPTFFARNATQLAKLQTSIDNAIKQATTVTNRLTSNYPAAKTLLNDQLDQMKVVAYPDKYKVAPDGKIIEITP